MDAPVYRRLQVWQRAMELVVESYSLAHRLPSEERYELVSQMRRAAVSIPANIAEGNGRVHTGDYLHHLSIARGSLLELDTLFEIARRLRYVNESDLREVYDLMDQVSRMLNALRRGLRR